MAKDKPGKTLTPQSGEVIPGGAQEPVVPVPTAKNRTVHRLLSMLSIWPFRNRAFIKSLETAQEVIEKQNKLEETIIKHGRTRGQLNDLGITLERDRLERRRELLEEQGRFSDALNTSMLEGEMVDQKNKLKRQELTLQQLEQKKRALQLEKELEELAKPPRVPEPAPPKPTRGRSEKQKNIERAGNRYDKEIERIEGLAATPETKTALRKSAKKELEEEMENIDSAT